jgi:hypothetical protein
MDIKEILKDYISYNWIEELITDKQKEDLEGQLDLYINGNSLLHIGGVSQRSKLLPEFLMEDLDGKILTSVIGSSDVTKEWNDYLGNCG